MTLSLLIDSQLAKLRNQANDKSHDFRVVQPAIELDPSKNYRTAMNRLITMTYSWHNVAAAYNNNKLKWRKTGEAWKTVTFFDRMFDYEKLNDYLQAETGLVDPDAEDKKTHFHSAFRFSHFSACDQGC